LQPLPRLRAEGVGAGEHPAVAEQCEETRWCRRRRGCRPRSWPPRRSGP
jgi:hypothetical protein